LFALWVPFVLGQRTQAVASMDWTDFEADDHTTLVVSLVTAAEYRFRSPDERLLHSIATATGGAYHPTPASLANADGDSRTARRPLWPALVTLALALWFLDLLLRRIRVFEPQVAEG
jgi:hypothetical protein